MEAPYHVSTAIPPNSKTENKAADKLVEELVTSRSSSSESNLLTPICLLKDPQKASTKDFLMEKQKQPMNLAFARSTTCIQFISMLISKKQFFVGSIRREVSKLIFSDIMKNKGVDVTQEYYDYQYKSDGMNVTSMYHDNPTVFGHGDEMLDPDAHPLNVDSITQHHRSTCNLCSTSPSSVSEQCYFSKLRKCITHGWKPNFKSMKFSPEYKCNGNYKTTASYPASVSNEIKAMMDNKVIRTCLPCFNQVVHPMGAVVKGSDKTRAMAILNLQVFDQKSLDVCNIEFKQLGLPKVKVRLSTDCTGTGVNRQAFCPRFSYPSYREAVRIIRRNSWLGLVDIGRYFNSFPWAKEMRPYMRFTWQDQLYEFLGLCFGFSVCPYYCSTWSAEFRVWMLAKGYTCTHMVDDWLFVADTQEEAVQACEHMANILTSCGFYMAIEKNLYGQSLKYLGIIFDTQSMTMRIDHTQALGTRLLMEKCLVSFRKNLKVEEGTMRHLAGKLNWFSEILQSGQLHIRSYWDYLRIPRGQNITTKIMTNILIDTMWWINILTTWEQEGNTANQYRILSASEIQEDPLSVYFVQSDASGEDGYGYYHGFLNHGNLRYYSQRWGNVVFHSSHAMELYSLNQFLVKADSFINKKILVWVTDSTSAALTINKGSCVNEEGLEILTSIFQLCDDKQLELVGLWVPRESNLIGDYLSHLAAILNRETAEGNLHEL